MSGSDTAGLHFRERISSGGADLPTLVFLHHFGGSGQTWDPVMDLMEQAGFRCVAPDLRGFGESAAQADNPESFSVTSMSNDITALVSRLGIGAHVLIGHSMGGKIALAIAARQPRALKAIVLLAPSPPTPEPMADAERARLLAGHRDRPAAEETLRKITARPLPDNLFAAALADMLRTSASAWRAWLEHGSREDISAAVKNVRAPVFIAVGAADEAITTALVDREITGRLELASPVRVVAGSGHLLPLEATNSTADFVFECVAKAQLDHARE